MQPIDNSYANPNIKDKVKYITYVYNFPLKNPKKSLFFREIDEKFRNSEKQLFTEFSIYLCIYNILVLHIPFHLKKCPRWWWLFEWKKPNCF